MKKIIIILCSSAIACSIQAQVLKSKTLSQSSHLPQATQTNVKNISKPVLQLPGKSTHLSGVTGVYSQRLFTKDNKPMSVNYRLNNLGFAVNTNNIPERKINQFSKNYQEDGNNDFNCSTENIQVKITNDSYMRVPVESQASNIYPGVIYQFENYINGSWKPENNNRYPITISTSVTNMSGSPNEVINNPDRNNVRAGIVNLFSRFTRRPEEIANGAFKVRVEEIWNASDLDIKIGATGYGGGFSANNNFILQKKNNSRCFLFDLTKEMFSIDVSKPATGFFNQEPVTTSPLMYISSVTYGLRVIALVQIEISSETIANNFNGSYNALTAGGSVAIDVASNINNSHTTISMFVVGGQSDKVYQEYGVDAMKVRLQQITASVNYNNSKPILYQFRNMNDEVVRYSSATDWFPMRNCEPKSEDAKPANFTVSINDIKIDSYSEDDVDPYGTIRAEIIDNKGNVIHAQEGNDMLADIPAEQYIRRDAIKNYTTQNRFNKKVFTIGAGNAPGSKLRIIYWLRDRDDFGDDDIVMSGRSQPDFINPGNCKHYIQTINLDAVKKGSFNTFPASFTDDGGSYPFTVSIGVEK